jgi:hypothetical protein
MVQEREALMACVGHFLAGIGQPWRDDGGDLRHSGVFIAVAFQAKTLIASGMAWRIDTAIIRGELDNTERGRVQVRLEIVGRQDPLFLDLSGDAWRDVAGTRLSFVNRSPEPLPVARLLPAIQSGVVGDITASRKVKVFTVPEEEWREAYRQDRIDDVPTEWRNSLYLEWFTAEHGRCVIESADFEIVVNEHAWEMDEDEEAAQRMANMHSMREYLGDIIQRREPTSEDEAEDDVVELTEEQWEEQLKASDRVTDASMEAHDKYSEDDDNEEKIAFVMGWDHLIEDMADEQESVEPSGDDSEKKKRRHEWIEQMNAACAEVESEDWREPEKKEPHPLQVAAQEFIIRLIHEMREVGLNEQRGESPEHPLERFTSNTMKISGKLAGALSSRRMDVGDDTGYILAISKRCLNWANEALAALNDLDALRQYAAHRPRFENWRAELFKIREGLTDLRHELRKE